MAYFVLSGITGCVTSGETNIIYGQQFNDAAIETYYKQDYYHYNNILLQHYGVVCVFGAKTYSFKFLNSTDRDTFYTSLP